jgi:hypothetical protein
MGKKAKAPPPIDPKETAKAATGTNISTAIANTAMGAVNQVGPGGTVTRTQTGTQKVTDPSTGVTYEVPTYTDTTKLSEVQQGIYDQTNSAVSGRLSSLGGTRKSVEDALMARLNPQIERDRAALEARLANQGLTAGSRAYGASQDDFSRGVTDARLGAILSAGQEESAAINNINALKSGGQIGMPQSAMSRPAQAATVDTAGLINTQQQQQMQAYQQQQANRQGILGGLFGIGSAGILALSDRRLKTDIEKVEERPGPDVYDYRYKTDPKGTKRRGYMAQEVQKTQPDAVKKMGKYLAVDYSKLPAVR